MSDRQQLLKEINETSFAVNDVMLYLDTHPTDENALSFFDEMMKKRKQALQKYENEFEPILVDCVDTMKGSSYREKTDSLGVHHWAWADGPVPWIGGES